MTKKEQMLLDKIRAANDAGDGANSYHFLGRTKGQRTRWHYSRGEPRKDEVKALERLVASGDVEVRCGRYYVANHPALASTVANLPEFARRIEGQRRILENLEEEYAREQAFAQRWVK